MDFKYLLQFCALIAFIVSINCETKGAIGLDSMTFNKVVPKFRAALVKFDTAYPYGEKVGEWLKVAEDLQVIPGLLVADVRVRDDEKIENEDLANRYGIKKDDFPQIKLFLNGDLEKPLTFEDKDFKADNIKLFVKSKVGSKRLDSCLEDFDNLALKFRGYVPPNMSNTSLIDNKSMDRESVVFECELERLEFCEANFITNTASIAKTTTQTEILQICQSLERDVDCLLNFLNNCQKMENSSSFAILSYIFEKNRNIVDKCRQRMDEWVDPQLNRESNVIETNSGICVKPKYIIKCDQKFVDFDVGKDFVKSGEQCQQYYSYKKCLTKIVDRSKCSQNVKDIAFQYLDSRVRFAIDCTSLTEILEEDRDVNRVLVDTEMQSAIDVILKTDCKRSVTPLMDVCTRQYQKRIDGLNVDLSSQPEHILPHLCCGFAELTKCVTVITLLKCGKDEALRVSHILEALRQVSSPQGCQPYQYGTEYCNRVLI